MESRKILVKKRENHCLKLIQIMKNIDIGVNKFIFHKESFIGFFLTFNLSEKIDMANGIC